ncbi:Coq4 family protein [Anabaena sp. UHCC 0451]|uniref:Coq4 family protein n=1 Tax=Anabaena sp. UHCC 0451 TaxID=2055235 RepID=UPI002B1F570B|nr:Coq4 family protein [Anabaena sp. UHCC 0451]MEA5576267.1 Coq4 family protein [Anabaena sp. UHCC 0451]
MAMKIKVKNLGALKQAEFTLGDLTIICGGNNTGKTYATYALFGFLYTWRRMFSIQINGDKIEQLLTDGVIRLDIQEYVNQVEQIVFQGCQVYSQELPNIFAASVERFKNTGFHVDLDIHNISLVSKFDVIVNFGEGSLFSITKSEESTELVITLVVDKEKVKIPNVIIERFISDALKNIIFVKFLPRPFIASSERTGAAIFRKDLNFDRNRLLEDIGSATIFNGSKGECKRADFIIVADTDRKKVILCIEMKAKVDTAKEWTIIQQFKGAKCFVEYFKKIGKEFWGQTKFIDSYVYRFVTIRDINIDKKTTREKMIDNHDIPERMLKISSPHYLQFFSAHITETHDIWHIVTGSDTNILGEIQLEAFYVSQLYATRFWLALLTKNLLKVVVYDIELSTKYMDAIAQGWMIAKQAKPLFGIEWKLFWETPLDDVRTSLNIILPAS